MLNILVLERDVSNFETYYKNPFYLWEQLGKIARCVVLTTNQFEGMHTIQDVINLSEIAPDFIIINELIFYTECPQRNNNNLNMRGFDQLHIPVGYVPHDIEAMIDVRRQYIIQNNISLVFPIIKHAFLREHPEFTTNVRWLPHHVNTDIFKDYGNSKDIDSLIIGRIRYYIYPLRQKVVEVLSNHPGFVYYRHACGEMPLVSNAVEVTSLFGENYAQVINRAKIFFTCCSVLQYPVLKYFETLACRTLLFADTCPELEELGFIPDTHFVKIDEHNIYEKNQYYLENEEERDRIATNGYDFVTKNHSTQMRAQQLVDYITEHLGKR